MVHGHTTITTFNALACSPIMPIFRNTIVTRYTTRGQSNLTKNASRGAILRLGVTPGGRNLYH